MGAQAALQTASGSVATSFSLVGYDHRRGLATYALRIVNRSQTALVCRTLVISRNGEAMLAYPVLFEIQPFSTTTTDVPVWPADFHSFDRALAEVVGDGVHCIVEAAAPAVNRVHAAHVAMGAATVALGSIAVAAVAFLSVAMPRIGALAAPPTALSGTTVQAEYDASGIGKLSYLVLAPDGHSVAGGPLADRSGSILVPISASSDSGAYTVQMQMQGPLGTAKESRVVNAQPARDRSAQISDITVTPVVAKPDSVIRVAYSASGDDGYVRLVGTDGTIWAQEPYSRSGVTHFTAPALPNMREMRVLLHVTKGRSAAESSAGVVVGSAPAPAAAPAQDQVQVAGDDSSGAAVGADSGANGTFEVLSRTIASGAPVRVHVLSPRNDMRISLYDTQSHEVTGVDVGSDADTVSLTAPAVQVPTRYTVVASFTDGFGQESIVAPITVVPSKT